MDGENGIARIIRARKHGRKSAVFQFGFERIHFALQFKTQAFIVQPGQFQAVTQASFQRAPIFEFRTQNGRLLA